MLGVSWDEAIEDHAEASSQCQDEQGTDTEAEDGDEGYSEERETDDKLRERCVGRTKVLRCHQHHSRCCDEPNDCRTKCTEDALQQGDYPYASEGSG